MPLRGPYCFNCEHMDDPSHCEQLTICGVDEVRYNIIWLFM